jgi:hypothetical protein
VKLEATNQINAEVTPLPDNFNEAMMEIASKIDSLVLIMVTFGIMKMRNGLLLKMMVLEIWFKI